MNRLESPTIPLTIIYSLAMTPAGAGYLKQMLGANVLIAGFRSSDFGSIDPEGIAHDNWQGHLFVVDGVNEEVYEIAPGSNGIFNGAPPTGDDQVTHFDTTSLGLGDPEGIEFNHENGHLYILSDHAQAIAETETDGTLIRYIDISPLNTRSAAGLAYAPGSSIPIK